MESKERASRQRSNLNGHRATLDMCNCKKDQRFSSTNHKFYKIELHCDIDELVTVFILELLLEGPEHCTTPK